MGRICCDSEGRVNARSLVLQGNQDVVRGRTMPLDASQVASYSLFPGQVVGAKATNPTGHRLVATEVMADATSGGGGATRKRVRQELQIVVASGPYTTTDNFRYLVGQAYFEQNCKNSSCKKLKKYKTQDQFLL